MAMEWTIMIEGKNEFGEVCQRQIQIDKSWERLRDGEIGLSIDDGKTIMKALQSAVVNQEMETSTLSFDGSAPTATPFGGVCGMDASIARSVISKGSSRSCRRCGGKTISAPGASTTSVCSF
jgi:hypothetical protein